MLESERRRLHGWASERQDMLRLGREERDHIAGHALDSIQALCEELSGCIACEKTNYASNKARRIAALSNLLGDIGWEREASTSVTHEGVDYFLGELFPVAQLRPWLEEWQRQDDEAARNCEEAVEANHPVGADLALREAMTKSRQKLGTGAILLARLEKWMASHGN